jgi:hypothetical protein
MDEELKQLIEKLENLLNTMKDWERKPVIEAGKAVIEVVKMPKRETKKGSEPERLALHLRLRDSFRGIFIESYSELDDILRALTSKSVQDIAKAIDELNKRRSVVEYKL